MSHCKKALLWGLPLLPVLAIVLYHWWFTILVLFTICVFALSFALAIITQCAEDEPYIIVALYAITLLSLGACTWYVPGFINEHDNNLLILGSAVFVVMFAIGCVKEIIKCIGDRG